MASSIRSSFSASAFNLSLVFFISSNCFLNAIISSFSSTGLVSVIGFSPKASISFINSFLAFLICFFSSSKAAAASLDFFSSAFSALISSSCFLKAKTTSSASTGSFPSVKGLPPSAIISLSSSALAALILSFFSFSFSKSKSWDFNNFIYSSFFWNMLFF